MAIDKKGIIGNVVAESEGYQDISQLSDLLDSPERARALPIWPIYFMSMDSDIEQLQDFLPMLTERQRQQLRDIGSWKKDHFDIRSFEFWIKTMGSLKDEQVVNRFVSSIEFKLFLKGRFNIKTFDVEDPEYPDHDNYFLTEDQQFLIEFDDKFSLADEMKTLLMRFYAKYGVNQALDNLLTIINESYYSLLEDAYSFKKERLRDIGYVDYYDAIEFISLKNRSAIDKYINEKIQKGIIKHQGFDDEFLNQIQSAKVLSQYKEGLDDIERYLLGVDDPIRSSFLQFNFMRTINGVLTLKDGFEVNPVKQKRIAAETKSIMNLGLQYILKTVQAQCPEINIFKIFDFVDLYKVAYGLLYEQQKKAQQIVSEFKKEFLFSGELWNHFIEDLALNFFELKIWGEKKQMGQLDNFELLKSKVGLFTQIMPIVKQFYLQFNSLKESGAIQDQYYLNYSVEDIDFEALLLTQYVRFTMNGFEPSFDKTLALSPQQLRDFCEKILAGKHAQRENFQQKFIESYGLSGMEDFPRYLQALLDKEFSGIDFSNLDEKEFKHISGVILLRNAG